MAQWTGLSRIGAQETLMVRMDMTEHDAKKAIVPAESRPGQWHKYKGVQVRRDGNLYSVRT